MTPNTGLLMGTQAVTVLASGMTKFLSCISNNAAITCLFDACMSRSLPSNAAQACCVGEQYKHCIPGIQKSKPDHTKTHSSVGKPQDNREHVYPGKWLAACLQDNLKLQPGLKIIRMVWKPLLQDMSCTQPCTARPESRCIYVALAVLSLTSILRAKKVSFWAAEASKADLR